MAVAEGTTRLSLLRRLVYPLFSALLSLVLRLLWASYRVEILEEDGEDRAVPGDGTPVIPCFWHQQMLPGCLPLARKRREGFRFGLLISPSQDGEFAARVARRLGVT